MVVLVSATNIYSILCVGVMYEAEESHIGKLLEEVLDEEINVEFGYESESLAMDLMTEHRGECAACSHLSRELRTKLDHISSKRTRRETFKISRSLCHLPPLKR